MEGLESRRRTGRSRGFRSFTFRAIQARATGEGWSNRQRRQHRGGKFRQVNLQQTAIRSERMAIERIKVGPRMSQAVVHGNTVYLAGQVADDARADVAGQTRQVLAKIDGLLAEAGTDKSKLLFANVWLSDISTFEQMN